MLQIRKSKSIVVDTLKAIAINKGYKITAESPSMIAFKKGGFFSLRTNGSTSHVAFQVFENDGVSTVSSSSSATQGGGLAKLAPDLSGDADIILVELDRRLNS